MQISTASNLVVDFKAKWCKNCATVEPLLQSLLRSAHNVELFVIDIDEVTDCTDTFDIQRLPCVQMYRGGIMSSQYVGSDLDALSQLISEFISICSSASVFQFTGDPVTKSDRSVVIQPEFPPIIPLDPEQFPSVKLPDYESVAFFSDVTVISKLDLLNVFDPTFAEEMPTNNIADECLLLSTVNIDEFDAAYIRQIYEYRVPGTSEDGSCSILETLAEFPFNLAINAYNIATAFNPAELRYNIMTERLVRLNNLIHELYKLTGADWIGVYRLMGAKGSHDGNKEIPTLVKEAYRGEPSRALFPVTIEFSEKSTNSWVALNGKARVIMNTNKLEEGVSYYKCSGNVQSELCVPILRRKNIDGDNEEELFTYEVIGIIDLESWNANHFSSRVIAEVLKTALDIGRLNIGLAAMK